MDKNLREQFIKAVADMIALACTELSDDVKTALDAVSARETDARAKTMYACIADNLALAKSLHRPVCQDTGILQFFLDVGTGFPYMDDIENVLVEAVKRATKNTPLRPNAVSPLGDENTGDNTGFGAPYIEYNLVPGNSNLRLRFYLSGGGCALPGRSKVLLPLEGKEGIRKFVCETVAEWGVNACPPLTVGIGIGADAASAAKLSKKALLRTIGTHNADKETAALEEEIKEALDKIGIAPLGFGGSASTLSVNIETAARHPATRGVGLSFGCWATRKGEMLFSSDLSCENLSHTGRTL